MSTAILRFKENLLYSQTIFQQIIDYSYKVARLKKIVTTKNGEKRRILTLGKEDLCLIIVSFFPAMCHVLIICQNTKREHKENGYETSRMIFSSRMLLSYHFLLLVLQCKEEINFNSTELRQEYKIYFRLK